MQTIKITAADGLTSATFVPERGGIGSSITLPWQNQAREILYCHDNFWDEKIDDLPGGWPFLFPICGRLKRDGELGRYLWNQQSYQLPIHGLSWWNPWQAESNSDQSQITLSLSSNDRLKQHYPFDFQIALDYRVEPGQLHCQQTVSNNSDEPMPYYAGFHPYLLMPDAGRLKADTQLALSAQHQLHYNDDLTDVNDGLTAPPSWPGSAADPNLNEQLFKLTDDHQIDVQYPDGFTLQMNSSAAFAYCQLYTMANKPFFCIEPWMGYPNGLNRLQGARWLAPGETESAWLTLSNTEAV